MARRNLATALKRRSRGDPMRAYDALPSDLRHWLAGSVLPWSPASVRRVWLRVLRDAGGDTRAAQAALTALEQRRLRRDVARIWGQTHPFLSPPDPDQSAAGRRPP